MRAYQNAGFTKLWKHGFVKPVFLYTLMQILTVRPRSFGLTGLFGESVTSAVIICFFHAEFHFTGVP